jgi:nucleoside-diphosphate-sugar epimerase
MILGNGLIANELKKNIESKNKNKVIYIASGVSNSSEVDADKFLREENLIKSTFNSKSKIIYFSTCSIYDEESLDSPYVRHKIKMENLIASRGDFFIFRVPQVVGFSINKSTLVNYLANKIKNREEFILWSCALRNLIDVHDLAQMVNFCVGNNLGFNKISNLSNKNFYTVDEIVKELESIIGIKAQYSVLENNQNFTFCTKFSESISDKLKITFDNFYLKNILNKYYKPI